MIMLTRFPEKIFNPNCYKIFAEKRTIKNRRNYNVYIKINTYIIEDNFLLLLFCFISVSEHLYVGLGFPIRPYVLFRHMVAPRNINLPRAAHLKEVIVESQGGFHVGHLFPLSRRLKVASIYSFIYVPLLFW